MVPGWPRVGRQCARPLQWRSSVRLVPGRPAYSLAAMERPAAGPACSWVVGARQCRAAGAAAASAGVAAACPSDVISRCFSLSPLTASVFQTIVARLDVDEGCTVPVRRVAQSAVGYLHAGVAPAGKSAQELHRRRQVGLRAGGTERSSGGNVRSLGGGASCSSPAVFQFPVAHACSELAGCDRFQAILP